MADAADVQEAARLLGARLAALRAQAGLSQPQFAPLIAYSRSTVANAETGRRFAARDFWQRCDHVLGTGGVLVRQYDELDALREQRQAAKLHASQAQRQCRQSTGWRTTRPDRRQRSEPERHPEHECAPPRARRLGAGQERQPATDRASPGSC